MELNVESNNSDQSYIIGLKNTGQDQATDIDIDIDKLTNVFIFQLGQ